LPIGHFLFSTPVLHALHQPVYQINEHAKEDAQDQGNKQIGYFYMQGILQIIGNDHQ
jgi:hypothetical protein